jgi:hypothetical protein
MSESVPSFYRLDEAVDDAMDVLESGVVGLAAALNDMLTSLEYLNYGFGSFQDYCESKKRTFRLAPDIRREVVEQLHEMGMSNRQIAVGLGINEKTVRRDIAPSEERGTAAYAAHDDLENATEPYKPGEESDKTDSIELAPSPSRYATGGYVGEPAAWPPPPPPSAASDKPDIITDPAPVSHPGAWPPPPPPPAPPAAPPVVHPESEPEPDVPVVRDAPEPHEPHEPDPAEIPLEKTPPPVPARIPTGGPNDEFGSDAEVEEFLEGLPRRYLNGPPPKRAVIRPTPRALVTRTVRCEHCGKQTRL